MTRKEFTKLSSYLSRPPIPPLMPRITESLFWDVPLWTLVLLYCVLCPWTKVEESFNVQAVHDLLFLTPPSPALSILVGGSDPEGNPLQSFDHFHFPGVVPRTFLGAFTFAGILSPVRAFLQWTGILGEAQAKLVLLLGFRVLLGGAVLLSLGFLRRRAEVYFQPNPSMDGKHYWRRMFRAAFTGVSCTQFHLLFYASRPLPNTFALILCSTAVGCFLTPPGRQQSSSGVLRGVWLLGAATIVFRCDVIVFAVPWILTLLWTKRLQGWRWILPTILFCLAVIILTVTVDSVFWGRWLWPELEVLLFNTVQNRSSEWGVSPWHWYWTSALPRALLFAYPLSFIGGLFRLPISGQGKERHWLDRDCLSVFLPTLLFVALYSFLPHKELRFIFPALPVLNLLAARGVCLLLLLFRDRPSRETGTSSSLRDGREKDSFGRLVLRTWIGFGFLLSGVAVGVFLLCSIPNYPGGEAIHALNSYHLQQQQHRSTGKSISGTVLLPPTVHIGNLAATTGVTRFHELRRCEAEDSRAEGGETMSSRQHNRERHTCLRHDKTEGLDDDLETFHLNLPESVCYILTEHPTVPGFEILTEEPIHDGVVEGFHRLTSPGELLAILLRSISEWDFNLLSQLPGKLVQRKPSVYIMRRESADHCHS